MHHTVVFSVLNSSLNSPQSHSFKLPCNFIVDLGLFKDKISSILGTVIRYDKMVANLNSDIIKQPDSCVVLSQKRRLNFQLMKLDDKCSLFYTGTN